MSDLGVWRWLVIGYLLGVLIEAPILLLGLSRHHPLSRRLFAGLWLTACTYPVVVLVFPALFDPRDERLVFLLVAETFAPVAECLLFWVAFRQEPGGVTLRDLAVIVLANLASFGAGEWLGQQEWFRAAVGL